MAKEDLRVQRTKKVLKDNFKDMLLNMDYERITIKDLCEKSMINRRTFYLHYDSIDDLMKDVLNDMSLEFSEYTKDYDHFAEPERIIKDYFEFTNANPLYEKLNNNSDLDYIREQLIIKVADQNEFPSLKGVPDNSKTFVWSFVVSNSFTSCPNFVVVPSWAWSIITISHFISNTSIFLSNLPPTASEPLKSCIEAK